MKFSEIFISKKPNEKSLIQEIKKFQLEGAKLDKNKKESPQQGEYIDLKDSDYKKSQIILEIQFYFYFSL